MTYQRFAWALLVAASFLGSLGAPEADAFGPRRVYYAPTAPYYYQPPVAYGYNPYVLPLPAYGILPQPLATWNMLNGSDYYGGRRVTEEYGPRDPLAAPPRMRASMYPAVPFTKSPDAVLTESRRARFEISVPYADAIVLFDGVKMKQTGLSRVYVTPPLDEGKEYSITIDVQWTKEDGTLSAPRPSTFTVTAGQTKQHVFVE